MRKTINETELEWFVSPLRKREDGNIIDQMGSCIVMLMIFAMIIAMVSYGKLTNMRLAIDGTVRNFLYIEEQEGYLSGVGSTTPQQNAAALTSSLRQVGCTSVAINPATTQTQVGYGEPVVLDVTVKFPNPIYTNLSSERHPHAWFTVPGLPREITYRIVYSSTSRW